MEQSEQSGHLGERVTRTEERMATKNDLREGEHDPKNEIVGVKSDLQKQNAKMDTEFAELRRLIEVND